MKNPLVRTAPRSGETPPEERNSSGLWSLEGDRLVSVEDYEDGPAICLVRSEHVLMMAVDLPPMPSDARRRAALPFAVEDRIAEPLEDVHVALGDPVGPQTFLAGAVRHALMVRWVARLREAGLDRALLVPDCLALPTPGERSWSVDLAGERAIVRVPDGTGFAVPLAMLEATWKAAGEPACIAYGDPLPPNMHAPEALLDAAPLAQRLVEPALDLRQGPYARPRAALHPLWKRIAVVTAMGAAAHAAIAAADTLVLNGIADDREAQVRSLAQNVAPSLTLGPDLSTLVTDLGDPGASGAPSAFLTLVSATAAAFAQSQVPVTWRSVAYDEAGEVLTLAVETDDAAGLQRVAGTLSAAGLDVRPGAVSSENGRAVASFAVTRK